MTKEYYLSELFAVEPETWGLRGDPYLWAAMRQYFYSTPLPKDPNQLSCQVSRAFKLLTGKPIETDRHFLVDEYAYGGMSSGHIAPDWWRDEAIPFLAQSLMNL
jgi:hypothetical protein